MAKSKKHQKLHCCIGISVRFSDHDAKILRIADIPTTDWKKNRVNTIGRIYSEPDEGPMLLPVKLNNNFILSEHDNLGIWMWKEDTGSEVYDVAPYSRHPKPPCKYHYYELIFLQNSESSPESPQHTRLVIDSDDNLASVLENGIVVPGTFSDHLLVVYNCDDKYYFCAEITKATSCLRYNQLLFVTDKKSLDRYKIERNDVIDSFDPRYKNLFPEDHVNLTRRFIYKKMKLGQKDKLEPLDLHTDTVRFAGYFYRIATRLNYSEDEKKLVNKIVNEALSNPYAQQAFTAYPESEKELELRTEIINSYLSPDDKVEEFVKGIIEHVPRINDEYIDKIQRVANQGLFEKKETLETEIANLKNKKDDLNGELLAKAAEKKAAMEALKSLNKTIKLQSERIRADQEEHIRQELKKFEENQKKNAVEEIEAFKTEQLQAIAEEGEQFRAEQKNIILNDLQSLKEESDRIQKDIDSLETSKKQLEKDILDRQHLNEELLQLEQDRRDLEAINEELKAYTEQRLRDIQKNPGNFLGDLALFKGLMPDGGSEKAGVATVPNTSLFVRAAENYGSDPLKVTNVRDLIVDLKDNLQRIGVDDEYAEILAKLIAGAYLTRTPLLLTGCNANLMANAISVTLYAQTPGVISVPTGYNDYLSLLDTVKNTCGNVVLLQNAVGAIDEYCYAHLTRDIFNQDPEKYILFSLDFTETMRILPPSILGYMVLINSEDVITSIEQEDLIPGNCAIPDERNLEGVNGFYQRVVKFSHGLSVTNGYNLTRTAILSLVAKADEESVDAALLLELASYCKILGTTKKLCQRLEYLSRDDLINTVGRLLGE